MHEEDVAFFIHYLIIGSFKINSTCVLWCREILSFETLISSPYKYTVNADKTKYMVMSRDQNAGRTHSVKNDSSSFERVDEFNPLNPELNPICYLLALLGAQHFLHVSRIRVKILTFRRLMSYMYGAPILDVSRSHTTTQHSR